MYDLVSIGGGTTGLVATQVARRLGGRVALIEAARPGGDCLWTGCVPSKALIASARIAAGFRHADRFGLDPIEPVVDLDRIFARVRSVQAAIEPADSADHLEGLGIDVITGRAQLVSPTEIQVTTPAGETIVSARKIVLATGSEPVVPPIGGLTEPLTTDTIWDLDKLPEHLLIVGGGAVGCELGQAFRRLGAAVTIVEAADRILPGLPADVAERVGDALTADGIEIITGRRLDHIDEAPPHDRVLVSVGRRARTAGLGLAAAGVTLSETASVEVDGALRTSTPNIYAGGDVTVGNGSTTLAVAHGRHIGLHALVGSTASRSPASEAVPTVVFTDPQVAVVGRHDGADSSVRFEHVDHDRTLTDSVRAGFTELHADRRGRLVGAVVVSPTAAESIAELALGVRSGASIDAISGPHAYPTFADASARAAEVWMQGRWSGPNRRGRAVRGVVGLRRWWDRRSEPTR